MALLNLISATLLATISNDVAKPNGLWEWLLINVFGHIENYGWRIIIFIVVLKLLLLPLDLFQRYKMRKNTQITEMLKPQVEKLKQQYAGDSRLLSAKQMELNKKAGYSYFSSCIPMVLTLVIFFTLFNGMGNISQYMMFREYSSWYETYVTAIEEYQTTNEDYIREMSEINDEEAILKQEIKQLESQPAASAALVEKIQALQFLTAQKEALIAEAENYAQDKVVEYNDEYAASFIWIKSIWQPDVMWKKPIHENKSAFVSNTTKYSNDNKGKLDKDLLEDMINKYDKVTKKLVESPDNKQNGLLILVILAVLLSIGSQFIMQRLQKRSGQFEANGTAMNGGMMKMMLLMMPVIIGVFALRYTAAFALYMVANSAMGILINVLTTLSMNFYDKNRKIRAADAIVAYGRPDPNAQDSNKKEKKNAQNANNSATTRNSKLGSGGTNKNSGKK